VVRLRLKQVLKEKEISMGRLSRLSDVSYSTIARICNDVYYSPSLAILERLARALSVRISDLYEEVDETK
jgi:transcriptional regulator with XRE-family HTH domain